MDLNSMSCPACGGIEFHREDAALLDLNATLRQLDELFAAQRYQEAEGFLREQIAAAEAAGDQGTVLSLCNELGGYYRVTTNFDAGIRTFQKAMAAIDALSLQGTEPEATTCLNLATLYVAARHADEALPLYERAAKVFDRPEYQTDYRTAALHNNIASLYLQKEQYGDALRNAQAALAIVSRGPGREEEIGVTNTLILQICTGMGDYAEAQKAADRAQAAFLSQPVPNPVHYAPLLSAMGQLCYRTQRYPDAAAYYEKSLAQIEQSLGKTLSYASELRNLAACRKKMGDSAGEAACLRSAEALEQGAQGKEPDHAGA